MSNFVERESLENYLETLLMLQKKQERVRAIDIASALQFSRASVSRAIHKMREAGYLTLDATLTFTAEGLKVAHEVVRRHELLTKFFVVVSGVEAPLASRCACRVEHVISRETAQGIGKFLVAKGVSPDLATEVTSYLPEADERLESEEDYLEAIYVLILKKQEVRAVDVARDLGLTRASVSRGLALLKEKGLIEVTANGLLLLTVNGTELAEKIWEKHQAISTLLAVTTGIDDKTASREACRIEHMISDEVYAGIKLFLTELGKKSPTSKEGEDVTTGLGC